jgi:two-component system, chemotaxis family, chemotaxis protein CheY
MTTRSRHILVVEDNVDIRESFEDILALEGFPAQGVSNGREALEELAKDPLPALVLLDMMLPVMSGNDVLVSMRRSDRLRTLPVVLISTGTKLKSAKDLARYASTYGVAATLAKPLEPEQLLAIIRRFVPDGGEVPHAHPSV